MNKYIYKILIKNLKKKKITEFIFLKDYARNKEICKKSIFILGLFIMNEIMYCKKKSIAVLITMKN